MYVCDYQDEFTTGPSCHRVTLVSHVTCTYFDTHVTVSLFSLLTDGHGPTGAAGAADTGSATPSGEWSTHPTGP